MNPTEQENEQYTQFVKWYKDEYGYAPDDSEIDGEQWKRVAHRERGFRAGWLARAEVAGERERAINTELKRLKQDCNYCTVCMNEIGGPESIAELLGEPQSTDGDGGRKG